MMSREIIGSEVQGSDSWHEARLGIFTGSQLKNLVSLTSDKPKHSADKYIYETMAEVITGEVESITDNQYMKRGRELEPIAMSWLEDYLETELIETGALLMDWSDRVAVSPDRIGVIAGDLELNGFSVKKGDKIVVESKSPKSTTFLRWSVDKKMPSDHKIQVQAEIMVTKADYALFLAYDDRCTGRGAYVVKVMPDLKFQDRIKSVCLECLDKLDKRLELSKNNTIDISSLYF